MVDYEQNPVLQDHQEMSIAPERGKPVPVLLPADVREPLKYLANPVVRAKGGVKADSPYLFANTGHGVYRALDCLREVLVECGADLLHPERLTSTGYRAYMATVSQCVGLQPHQVQWLCDHLGHTEDIHKTYYRHTLGGIERVQLGKLILMQDLNVVGKFSGKSLDEIQFTDILGQVDGAPDEGQSVESQHFEDPVVEEEPALEEDALGFADPVNQNEETHRVNKRGYKYALIGVSAVCGLTVTVFVSVKIRIKIKVKLKKNRTQTLAKLMPESFELSSISVPPSTSTPRSISAPTPALQDFSALSSTISGTNNKDVRQTCASVRASPSPTLPVSSRTRSKVTQI